MPSDAKVRSIFHAGGSDAGLSLPVITGEGLARPSGKISPAPHRSNIGAARENAADTFFRLNVDLFAAIGDLDPPAAHGGRHAERCDAYGEGWMP